MHYTELLLNNNQPKNFNVIWNIVIAMLQQNKNMEQKDVGIHILPSSLLSMVASFLHVRNYIDFALTCRLMYYRTMRKIQVSSLSAAAAPVSMHRFSKIVHLSIDVNILVSSFTKTCWQVKFTLFAYVLFSMV